MFTVVFQPARLATSNGSEDACFALVNGTVAAILVRYSDDEILDGWYLESGFGPWDREGLAFSALKDAEAWLTRTVWAK